MVCLLIDYLVIKLYSTKTLSIGEALALHFTPAFVLAAGSIALLTSKEYAGWLLFLATLQAAFGLLGIIGFIATIIFRQHFIQEESHQKMLIALLCPEKEVSISEQLVHDIRSNPAILRREIDILPFRDRIHLGDPDQKRAVLTHIGSHFSPAFTPILKECMQDPDASVRVQAATVMTKVSNHLQDHLIQAKKQYDVNSHDNPALLDLARAYEEYAFSGTLDPTRQAQLNEEAGRCYRAYLKGDNDKHDVTIAYGRLLLRTGCDEDAFEVLHGLWKQDDPSNSSAATWLMEACYRTGRYECLRRVAKALDQSALEEVPLQLREAVQLWAEPQLAC